MSTDRELLELAAKAAGIYLIFVNGKPKEVTEHFSLDPTDGPHEREWDWNPLTDDGDALRLAVKLDMDVASDAFNQKTMVMCNQTLSATFTPIVELHGTDPYAATRRAIVRAAAAIGGAV